MLDTVSKLIESISLAWWALIVPHFWDIAFLALILWCIDLVLRKASATWRYALWCVLLAKILLPFETSSPFSITDNLTRSFDPLSLFVSSPSSESNPGQGEYFAPNLDIQQMHGGSPPPSEIAYLFPGRQAGTRQRVPPVADQYPDSVHSMAWGSRGCTLRILCSAPVPAESHAVSETQ